MPFIKISFIYKEKSGTVTKVKLEKSKKLKSKNQRYYILFPGYLTVLLKIKISCKFFAEFCNLRWTW